ncbi:MAG: class I SAM-dependent methyltransferase [Anaerolineae bacterium]|nr:class I SAM-dependent methyltransferase [Anaerolineae bacterium]
MPLNWMDVTALPFNALLLLERVQLCWLPGWGLPQKPWALALQAHPGVAWVLGHKCPEIAPWVDELLALELPPEAAARLREAEVLILQALEDLLVYAVDPARYDAQPFMRWDDRELTDLVDFSGKTTLDIGAGTGKLALIAAGAGAAAVFAVEPVENLRHYMRARARERGLTNFYAVDGLITDIPFPEGFADVVLGGHVFGDFPEAELAELERVTKSGGTIILCPASTLSESERHEFLVAHGFAWAVFEEPLSEPVRKYWKTYEP